LCFFLLAGCAAIQQGSAPDSAILYPISLNDKMGYIDRTGTIVVPPQFDFVGDFSEALAWIKINGKAGSAVYEPIGYKKTPTGLLRWASCDGTTRLRKQVLPLGIASCHHRHHHRRLALNARQRTSRSLLRH
jgi:hypothetical protein